MKGRVEILNANSCKTFLVTNCSFRDFLDANLSQPIAGSMDHMEPSLSSEKVVGLFLYLKHHLTVKQFFGKRGILIEDEQVKNVFRLTFLARFISH